MKQTFYFFRARNMLLNERKNNFLGGFKIMKKLMFWTVMLGLWYVYENRKNIRLHFEKVEYEIVKER